MCHPFRIVLRASFWILVELLLLAGTVQGQQSLEGAVRNEKKEPIIGAVITLTNGQKGPVVAFTTSGAEGAYRLQWKEQKDSLWIRVSHLSHASQEQPLTTNRERIDWTLSEQTFELPEVMVEQPAVVRRGDTLVFDVNQLKEASDENIEQILARIPGIKIESSGQILYQDLPISKFYIEGLDLLEGRYALATRNLSIEAIRDIEILEEHQPVRALDSLITPPNAAINLRLKSDIAITGKLEGGGGLSPALYAGMANSFGFQKQQQFHALASANNVGEQKRDDFRDLYGEISYDMDLLRPVRIIRPVEVPSSLGLINQEFTGGANYLRRLSEHAQLKWQAYASRDQLQLNGSRERILRDSQQSITFDEELNALERLRSLNGKLTYELNDPTWYTKLSVASEGSQTNTDVDNQFNQNPSQETFAEDEYTLEGRLESIWRKGDKAYRLWSEFDYERQHLDLTLRPLNLIVETSEPQSLSEARQAAFQQSWRSDTYTSFLWKRQALRGQFKAGLLLKERRLNSTLYDGEKNKERSLGAAFENQIEQSVAAPYQEQHYVWQRRNGKWQLHIPLALHRIRLQDRQGQSKEEQVHFLVYEPQLEYSRELLNSSTFTTQITYRNIYDQQQQFYTNYILRSNRQFDRQLFRINRKRAFELSLRFQGTNHFKGLHYNTHLRLARTAQDWLTTTIFNPLGEASQLVTTDNVQRSAKWTNTLEASLGSNLQAKLKTNYMLLRRPVSLNAQQLTLTIQQASVAPYLSYTFSKSVISLETQANYYHMDLMERPAWRTQFRWVFFHQFAGPGGDLRLSFDQYFTWTGDQTVQNNLFSARYTNELPGTKLEYSVHLNNIFNALNFISYQQMSFTEELSYYQLRPRQLVLHLEWSF